MRASRRFQAGWSGPARVIARSVVTFGVSLGLVASAMAGAIVTGLGLAPASAALPAPTTQVTVGGSTWETAVSPDGSTVYVANNSLASYSVSVVSTSSRTVTATITGLVGPAGVAVNPKMNDSVSPIQEAYVTNRASTTGGYSVQVIDTSTNTLSGAAIHLAGMGSVVGVSVTPDGATILAVDRDGDCLWKIAQATRTGTCIAVTDQPTSVAVTPDGTQAVVTSVNSNSVSIVTLATGQSTPVSVGAPSSDVAIVSDGSAGGSIAYVTKPSGSISVIPLPYAGSGMTTITTGLTRSPLA